MTIGHKGLRKERRRRPTLPHSHPCSTIGAEELNFRVRNGNGWDLFAMATEKTVTIEIAGQLCWKKIWLSRTAH